MSAKTPIYLIKNATNADAGRAIYTSKGARKLVHRSQNELG